MCARPCRCPPACPQLERLLRRDGGTREYALTRIASQMPLARKCARADVVLDNSGSAAELQAQVKRKKERPTPVARRACKQEPPTSAGAYPGLRMLGSLASRGVKRCGYRLARARRCCTELT